MCSRPPSEKWRRFRNIQPSHAKSLSVAHSPYDIYSMVGRSIASISDLGGIFTSALCALVNMAPRSYMLSISINQSINQSINDFECIVCRAH